MTEHTLPLFELFTRLRQADLPLGIDEYKLLLQALEAGFGGPDLDALAHLCRTLWIKSEADLRVFERHFQQIMVRSMTRDAPSSSASTAPLQTQGQASSSHIPPVSQPAPSANVATNVEAQAVQAVLHTASEDELPYNHFVRSDEYFPVTRRQMKQSWRYLRRPVREGPAIDVDIERTVEKIGRQEMLLEPVFVARHVNRVELLLLMDQGGSMVPFHALSRRLAETALRGGNLSNAEIYYFRNSPVEHLFLDPSYQEARPIQEVIKRLHEKRAAVLLFSDAGAARGHYNEERYILTKEFLDQLKQHTRYSAWLNPMPPGRWVDTTAERIAQIIPMFDVSRRGLDTTISVLCGRFLPRREQSHHG